MNFSSIWRRENLRWCCLVPLNGWICFKAVKSSSRSVVHPSTPLHVISTSACIWTRHLILPSSFHKMYETASARLNFLQHIRSSIDTFRAQRIYQSMITPIFTYCGYNSLGWSESRKRVIRSFETRSLEIIYLKYSPQNCDLRFLKIYNFLQRQRAAFYLTAVKETDVSHLGTTSNDNIITRYTLETMGKQQSCQGSNWILGALAFTSWVPRFLTYFLF